MKTKLVVASIVVFCLPAAAQAVDWQNRDGLHLQTDISQKWFLPMWSTTNLRSETPNNTNLFGGLGYRGKSWWLESMVQRQLSPATGDQWMLDFRYDRRNGPWHLYVEVSPFISKPAFYEFVIVERRAWKRLSLRAETENTHRLSAQKIAAGGGLALSFGKHHGWDLGAAAVYRFSPTALNEPRIYLAANRRFSLHKGSKH